MAQRYHIFSLPQDLLDVLSPRNLGLIAPSDSQLPDPSTSLPNVTPNPTVNASAGTNSNARACTTCPGASAFPDVDAQRTHFRSDWHRYNVKIRLLGTGAPITETAFAQLVDDLDDSLSGSASSSSDDDESDEPDAVDALVLKSQSRSKTTRVRSPSPTTAHNPPQSAIAWFHAPAGEPTQTAIDRQSSTVRPPTQIGIYRLILPLGTPPSSYLAELRALQARVEGGRSWALFMVAGGHFAGAVARVARGEEDVRAEGNAQGKRKGRPQKPKPEVEILKHKTFHRYTTRRKQGGSQSVNDNAKGAAISAGAQLRRYGEQALREDIRALLQDWAPEIDGCERIWIRASVSNRRIFLDYEGCVIAKGDDRLRTFPFPTRRPTQSELTRCLLELTQVKTSHLTEDALRAQDEAYLAALPKPKPAPPLPSAQLPSSTQPPTSTPKPHRLTKDEEALREKWARLLEMVAKGRLEPLKAFWAREGHTLTPTSSGVGEDSAPSSALSSPDAPLPDWAPEHRRTASLLQLAAHAGQEDVVRWLLYDLHADPTIAVPARRDGNDDGDDQDQDQDRGGDKTGQRAADSDSDAPALPPTARRTAYDLARTRGVRDVFRRCAADHPEWWDWLGAARVPSALSAEKVGEREGKRKVQRRKLRDRLRERERERDAVEREPEHVEEQRKEVVREPRQEAAGPQKLGGAKGAAEGTLGLTPEMRARVERERRARAAEARLKLLAGQ
ncbi:hypothetical protein BV22DRAFT_1032943 [Leucogyrophana mollusca]|uniref:Uncharacterized protein n=1 Tax=Leucogyrophana mollusca TaxID=85980 RepID=A0ACB8BLR9_9AGAM|nr:hypothetical protein BV22DRAFT_1032943 [Leucogyrophana mollusca]